MNSQINMEIIEMTFVPFVLDLPGSMLQVSSCTSSVEVENSFLESSGDGDGDDAKRRSEGAGDERADILDDG